MLAQLRRRFGILLLAALPAVVAGCGSIGLGEAGRRAPAPARDVGAHVPGASAEPRLVDRLYALLPQLRPAKPRSHRGPAPRRPGRRRAHGGAPPLSKRSVRLRIVEVATREWRYFGGATWRYRLPSTGHAHLEYEPGYRERVMRFWKVGVGRTVTDTRRIGWSGAFISYTLKQAGAGRRFPYSGTHTTYIAAAIANRKRGRLDAPIVGYRPREIVPRRGDLICNSLTAGVDYDRIDRSYAAHCDIVVGKSFGHVEVIGGNLTNSVRKRTLLADEAGHIYPTQPRRIDPYVKRWFVVIRVNM